MGKRLGAKVTPVTKGPTRKKKERKDPFASLGLSSSDSESESGPVPVKKQFSGVLVDLGRMNVAAQNIAKGGRTFAEDFVRKKFKIQARGDENSKKRMEAIYMDYYSNANTISVPDKKAKEPPYLGNKGKIRKSIVNHFVSKKIYETTGKIPYTFGCNASLKSVQ